MRTAPRPSRMPRRERPPKATSAPFPSTWRPRFPTTSMDGLRRATGSPPPSRVITRGARLQLESSRRATESDHGPESGRGTARRGARRPCRLRQGASRHGVGWDPCAAKPGSLRGPLAVEVEPRGAQGISHGPVRPRSAGSSARLRAPRPRSARGAWHGGTPPPRSRLPDGGAGSSEPTAGHVAEPRRPRSPRRSRGSVSRRSGSRGSDPGARAARKCAATGHEMSDQDVYKQTI